MSIMLGNFSVEQMEKRLEISFPSELVKLMKKTHQEEANKVAKGKWHCYDIPFCLVCGGKEFAQKIYNFLKPCQDKMRGQLRIAISKEK